MDVSPGESAPRGPLSGVRVLELQGLGPGPFCAMLLSDFGAEVVRVDRPSSVTDADPTDPPADVLSRGRRSIAVDLKAPSGVELLLRLVERADVLIEGFRPGVTERVGLGPEVCLERNPRLIYGRVTGWGREGPYAPHAGHDINYLALSGNLWSIGRSGERPVPPLTYVGDFGGGGMLLALGICAALAERAGSGRGQVVDTAMVDGAALLNGFVYGLRDTGGWTEERGANLLDSGAPFYDVYETSDGRWVSVGAIEPQFYRNLLTLLGLGDEPLDAQNDPEYWPILRARLTEIFRTRTRDEWCALLEGREACFAPVLSPWEAPRHPHNRARGTFTECHGRTQPAAAPHFGRTPAGIAGPAPHPGQHTGAVLREWGLNAAEIGALRELGSIAESGTESSAAAPAARSTL